VLPSAIIQYFTNCITLTVNLLEKIPDLCRQTRHAIISLSSPFSSAAGSAWSSLQTCCSSTYATTTLRPRAPQTTPRSAHSPSSPTRSTTPTSTRSTATESLLRTMEGSPQSQSSQKGQCTLDRRTRHRGKETVNCRCILIYLCAVIVNYAVIAFCQSVSP
jgi:hypothetical protein